MQRRWLIPGVSAALFAAALVLFFASRRVPPAAVPAGIGEPSAVERALRDQLEAAQQELEHWRQAELDEDAAPVAAVKRGKPAAAPGVSPELELQLETARQQAADAQQQLAALREKLEQTEARIGQVEQQQTEAKAAEKALREQLEMAMTKAADLESERKSVGARVAQLETANAELRKKQDDSARRLAQLRKIADSMEDLSRRRESYLHNIFNRYREATDLFRTLALRLDSLRDGTAAGGNELSRIQNAVSLADEDLRQLRALNARANDIQKDLRAAAR